MKNLLLILVVIFSGSFYAADLSGDLNGRVINKFTKEPLIGVNIIIMGGNEGTATDLNGEFKLLNVNSGTYQIRFSAIGFKTVIKTDVVISSAKPVFLEVELVEEVIELENVTIVSGYFDSDLSESGSNKSFSYEEIRRSPGGFEDVIRALSTLPGIGQVSAGRNDLVVRGGAPSENLYLIDGYVIPNINHFTNQGASGGALSFVNLDYVSNTTFSTGGFSVLYGDKLSSALKIGLREGRQDKIGGKATISATQFGLNLEGPLGEKGNFLFSARRSYLDFIFEASGFSFVPEYYDFLSKFTYNLDNSNKISYLFIGAFDRVNFNNESAEDLYDNSRILGSNQNQYLTGMTWRHLFKNGFFDLSLSRTFTDFETFQKDTLLEPIFLNNSLEAENELKGDLIYKLSESSEMNLGFNAKLIKFKSDIKLPFYQSTFGEVLSNTEVSSNDYFSKFGLYGQYTGLLFDRINFNIGARGDYFSFINNKFTFSPRLSLSYIFDDRNTLKFHTGIYYQTPSYIWLIAESQNRNLKSLGVQQYILGFEHLLREDTKLKIESFIKSYTNYPVSTLREYLILSNTGANYTGTQDNFASFGLEPLVSEGVGNVKGVEFSIQKKSSSLPYYGIFSLTYSKSQFTSLDGIERPGTYDQSWITNLSGGYIFDNEWQGSFKFRFATGTPYTPFNSDGTQNIADYNSRRTVSLHSLDLRVDKRWEFEGWSMITYLDIQNIYNNKRSNLVRYNYREGKIDDGSSIGILPSIGVSVEF